MEVEDCGGVRMNRLRKSIMYTVSLETLGNSICYKLVEDVL